MSLGCGLFLGYCEKYLNRGERKDRRIHSPISIRIGIAVSLSATVLESNPSEAPIEAMSTPIEKSAATTVSIGVLCTLASALTFAFVNVRNEMILGGSREPKHKGKASKCVSQGGRQPTPNTRKKDGLAAASPPSNVDYLTWLGLYGSIFSGKEGSYEVLQALTALASFCLARLDKRLKLKTQLGQRASLRS